MLLVPNLSHTGRTALTLYLTLYRERSLSNSLFIEFVKNSSLWSFWSIYSEESCLFLLAQLSNYRER